MLCERFNEYKWIVTGDIYYADESMVTNKELMLHEKELIAKGAIMPRPGWSVLNNLQFLWQYIFKWEEGWRCMNEGVADVFGVIQFCGGGWDCCYDGRW
jgi:hypothetical protein